MKHFSFLILLFFYQASLAQNAGGGNQQPSIPKGNGKVSGVVKDSTNQQPVEFANVTLNDPQTGKPVDGNVCDDKGKFTLHKVPNGNYNLVISFIGFENKTIPIKITDSNDQIDVGNITISPVAAVLKEVTVVGQKSIIEEKVDRTIYNAENDATTRGGDATDVLKRVPMLSVDLDGNVTMRGSQNIKVLINNKPSTITASSVADALKQIPADMIKTVEVITSPSAKYDAEGSAGIINIITKKNTLQGVTLNVDAGVGYRGSNLGLNGNYRKKNMGFSLGGFGRASYNVNGNFQNTQTTLLGGTPTVNVQSADTRSHGLFGNYTLGWDYDINTHNSLTASVKYGARDNYSFQDNLTTITNDLPASRSSRNVNVTDLSGTVDASLNYTHTFEKAQREFSLLTLYSRNNRTNNFVSNILKQSDNSLDSLLKNINTSFNQEVTLQGDYQTPFGNNQLLEMGGKSIMRKVSSDYKYLTAHDPAGPYAASTIQKPNVFDYNQNIAAGYLSYTVSFLKTYTLKAGARYEYTSINANFQNNQEGLPAVNNIPSYSVLVPSVNFSKKLKNGNTLKASFNRRIQRPSIQYLNPNLQASNQLNSTQGNPNLSPEYTNNYELAYSTYIKGSSLNFSTFMRNTNNSIQSIRDVRGDTIRTTYKNIGKEDAYGASIFAHVNIGNKFSLNGGTDVYYAVLKNNDPNPNYTASNQGWVVSGRLFGNYNLSNGWGFQFFAFYRGRQVQLQGYQGGFGIYSLSLKKDINEKRGSIGIGAENFFTPSFKIHSQTNSPIIAQNSVNTLRMMNVKVTFSYRIGKMGFDGPRKRRKAIDNDDLKEGGNGDVGNQTTGMPQQQQGIGGPPQNFNGQTGPGMQRGQQGGGQQQRQGQGQQRQGTGPWQQKPGN